MLTIRYFAGARAAAGRAEEKLTASTLQELVSTLSATHGDRLTQVLATASYLVDGSAWRDKTARLPDDGTVDVLPPFAGG